MDLDPPKQLKNKYFEPKIMDLDPPKFLKNKYLTKVMRPTKTTK